MIDLSIIIPVFNVEKFLSECLNSILEQEFSNFEIILVNDGSCDKSGEICDEFAKKDERIKVFHQENSGVSVARNNGIKQSKGNYLMFIDSDDFLVENTLKPLISELENFDILFFSYLRVFENGEIFELKANVFENESFEKFSITENLIKTNHLLHTTPWAYIAKTSLVKNNNLTFKSNLKCSEDFDFNMNLLEKASSLKGSKIKAYCYRQRQDSVTNNVKLKSLEDNLFVKAHFFRKYENAILANMYINVVLSMAKMQNKTEAKKAEKLVEKDIFRKTNLKVYNLAKLLFCVFGFYHGSIVFAKIRKLFKRS